MPTICAAIRDARIETGLSQAELGRRLGLSQASLTRLETTQIPTVDRLFAIEAALDLPPGTLLYRAGYLPRIADARDAISNDPDIPGAIRRALVAAYDELVAERRREGAQHA